MPTKNPEISVSTQSWIHSFLDTLNLVYNLNDTSSRQMLFELAQEKLDDEDMGICRKAHLGICLSLTHDYSRNPSDEALPNSSFD